MTFSAALKVYSLAAGQLQQLMDRNVAIEQSHISEANRSVAHPGHKRFIIGRDDLILITGASGFIGSKLLESLLNLGFRNLRCFTRPTSKLDKNALTAGHGSDVQVEVVTGNLLSPEDCAAATRHAAVIFHLAAGRGEKSFPDAYMNTVVTTRNLLDASLRQQSLQRFVNVSSFTVYTNQRKSRRRLLDESCPVERHPELRGEAYCYAKVKQDELVEEYGREFGLRFVTVRPGYVYGPGKQAISGRVGIDSFGLFLHLGGANTIPFTYVDNCAEAIALAGLTEGLDGEVFNVVDDELPSSRQFLRLYKQTVKSFPSLYLPHIVSYTLCSLWQWYAAWSEGQLPPVYNRGRWYANWKKTSYSNEKLKALAGWKPRVPTSDGLQRYFAACREGQRHD